MDEERVDIVVSRLWTQANQNNALTTNDEILTQRVESATTEINMSMTARNFEINAAHVQDLILEDLRIPGLADEVIEESAILVAFLVHSAILAQRG